MRLRTKAAVAFIVSILSTLMVQAQQVENRTAERFLQLQRQTDEDLQKQREQVAPLESMFDWQFGGWIDYYLFQYGDGIQSSRFVQRPSMSVWTRARIDNGAHEIFARLRVNFTYFHPGDEIDRIADWDGPEFDQLWYQIDVGRAFRLTQPSDPLQLKVRVGRQTVEFGTGYALHLPMDAVLLDAKLKDLRVQGLIGRAVPDYPNIDRSEPVAEHSDRCFYGVQMSYEGWQHHVPFIYALWNNDRTRAWPHTDWLQNYAYDSFYLGTGAHGSIVHNLNYWAEGVFESGHSFGDHAFLHQDYIQAWGWDLGLEKLFDVPTRPRASVEYMFASGDGDRLLSPTNAPGGNRPGTPDTSFVAFGARDAGISLAPALSNLHIWRVGGALAPLERWEFFRDLEIGTNWFLYYKNQAGGAISDTTATQSSGYVGWEMDYFINWRLTSDLSWTMRWGTFNPGTAYVDRASRCFLMTGVTWSF